MFCSICGNELKSETTKFCSKCGAAQAPAVSPAPPQLPQQPAPQVTHPIYESPLPLPQATVSAQPLARANRPMRWINFAIAALIYVVAYLARISATNVTESQLEMIPCLLAFGWFVALLVKSMLSPIERLLFGPEARSNSSSWPIGLGIAGLLVGWLESSTAGDQCGDTVCGGTALPVPLVYFISVLFGLAIGFFQKWSDDRLNNGTEAK